eukprot:6899866-Pyramimonas_sp.AAC.1
MHSTSSARAARRLAKGWPLRGAFCSFAAAAVIQAAGNALSRTRRRGTTTQPPSSKSKTRAWEPTSAMCAPMIKRPS